MPPERKRLALGLLLSLLFHALLLSLTFAGQGLGLPGFSLPWQNRRVEVHDLRVAILPAPAPTTEPLQSAAKATLAQPAGAEPAMLTVVSRAPPAPSAQPEPPLKLTPAARVVPIKPKKAIRPKPVEAVTASLAQVPAPDPSPAEQADQSAPAPTANPTPAATPIQDVMAVAQSNQATWTVPPAPEITEVPVPELPELPELPAIPAIPTPVTAVAPTATSSQIAAPLPSPRADVDAKQERARELAELDRAKQDAQRQAQQLEVERQEVAKQTVAQQQTQRQEADRQEAARVEAARVESERQEAARQEAERQTAARQETTRQDSARQDVARAQAARLADKQAEADKREERLRAIGRQLNEEADRRDAREAREAAALRSTSASTVRRGRLFGRSDSNAELILYAEAWSRKIQLNMTFDMIREAVKQPHADPLVTVAIRSDGSVEAITFVRSSGVPAIDEAIRRIVQSQANYQAFSPVLLLDYDVVEIRRTWHFDMAVRLY